MPLGDDAESGGPSSQLNTRSLLSNQFVRNQFAFELKVSSGKVQRPLSLDKNKRY